MNIHSAMYILWQDALARGLNDLALTYELSAIRRGNELTRLTIESNQFLTELFPPKGS